MVGGFSVPLLLIKLLMICVFSWMDPEESYQQLCFRLDTLSA